MRKVKNKKIQEEYDGENKVKRICDFLGMMKDYLPKEKFSEAIQLLSEYGKKSTSNMQETANTLEKLNALIRGNVILERRFNTIFRPNRGVVAQPVTLFQKFLVSHPLDSHISICFDELGGLKGSIVYDFFDDPILFRVEDSDEYHSLNVKVFRSNSVFLEKELKSIEDIEKHLCPFFDAKKCNGLGCDSWEELRSFADHPSGTKIYYPWKNSVFGVISYSDYGTCLRSDKCWEFRVGKASVYCGGCGSISTYIVNQRSDKKFPTFRLENDLKKPPKTKLEVDKEFLKRPLVRKIRKAFDSRKLHDNHPMVTLHEEQIEMVTGNPRSNNNMLRRPQTLQAVIGEELLNGEGLNGQWVEQGGEWFFEGNFVRPDKDTIKKYIDYFGYDPGLQEHPIDLMLIHHEAVDVTSGDICVSLDAAYGNEGFVQISVGGINTLIGSHDYGSRNEFFEKVRSQYQKIYDAAEENSSLKRYFGDALGSMKWVEVKEEREIRLAKFVTQFWLHEQLSVSWWEDDIIMSSSFVYFFENSSSHKEVKFMINSSVQLLYRKISEGKKDGLKCCQDLHIVAICSDSDPGTMKAFVDQGKRTPDLHDFELPYIYQCPVVDCDGVGSILELAEFNDVEHLLKETKRHHFDSTGFEGDKLALFPVRIHEKDGNPVPENTFQWMPVTKRVYERVHAMEKENPSEDVMSGLLSMHFNPTGREDMKTSFASVFYKKTVEDAIEHRLESRFSNARTKEEIEKIESDIGLSKNEVLGTKYMGKWVRDHKNNMLKKAPATDFDENEMTRSVEFDCQFYEGLQGMRKYGVV